MDLDKVFEVLESELRLSVASAARRRVFMHAGVVGWGGRAIVIPGRSFEDVKELVETVISDSWSFPDLRP